MQFRCWPCLTGRPGDMMTRGFSKDWLMPTAQGYLVRGRRKEDMPSASTASYWKRLSHHPTFHRLESQILPEGPRAARNSLSALLRILGRTSPQHWGGTSVSSFPSPGMGDVPENTDFSKAVLLSKPCWLSSTLMLSALWWRWRTTRFTDTFLEISACWSDSQRSVIWSSVKTSNLPSCYSSTKGKLFPT